MIQVHTLENIKCDACGVYLLDYPRTTKESNYALIDQSWAKFTAGTLNDVHLCGVCNEARDRLHALLARVGKLQPAPLEKDDRVQVPF